MAKRCESENPSSCSGSKRVSRIRRPLSCPRSRKADRCGTDFDAHITASSSPVRASRAKSSITSLCSVISFQFQILDTEGTQRKERKFREEQIRRYNVGDRGFLGMPTNSYIIAQPVFVSNFSVSSLAFPLCSACRRL